MMNDERWAELQQVEDMAYFRADLCCYSPESYTLEEKREICNEMLLASRAIERAMRDDFDQLPPELRIKLLDMLCASGSMSEQFWKGLLIGEMPTCPNQVAN